MQMKQNQAFFYGTYSNIPSFFIGYKMLKHFNDFLLLASFRFIAEVSKASKIKKKIKQEQFLIYKVIHYFIDFCNLFLDKVYLKNEITLPEEKQSSFAFIP